MMKVIMHTYTFYFHTQIHIEEHYPGTPKVAEVVLVQGKLRIQF